MPKEIATNKSTKKKNRPKVGLYIKERDVEVVKTLWRYRIMRESTLHQLCFPTIIHQRKVQARLKQLREAGYIGRPDPGHSRRSIHANDPPYWVERLGIEELLNGHPLSDEQRERLRVNKNLSKWKDHRLKHPLDLSEVRACLELALEKVAGVHLAAWWDEHDRDEQGPLLQTKVKIPYGDTGRERPFTLCPDACFILEDERSKREALFFLEIDEGTESAKKRWRDKILAYTALLRQVFADLFEFAGEDFRVLTITRSRAGKEQMQRKKSLLKTTYRVGGRGQFLFSTFDQVMPEGIINGKSFLGQQVWQRARENDIEQGNQIDLYSHLFT